VFVLMFLLLILVLGALVDLVRVPASQVKRGTKAGWFLAILLLPVLGGALWFAFGRSRVQYDFDEPTSGSPEPHDPSLAAERVGSHEGPRLHDDDMPPLAFTGTSAARAEARSTEQQLADLEAEIAYWDEWSRRNAAGSPAAPISAPAPEDDVEQTSR
jgi:hypothetical protein